VILSKLSSESVDRVSVRKNHKGENEKDAMVTRGPPANEMGIKHGRNNRRMRRDEIPK
jgi:hypothetical protein